MSRPALYLRKRLYRWANERKPDAVHLFLLAPPLTGSTVVQQLLGTSREVTTLPDEGQWLPEVRHVLGVEDRWRAELSVDWPLVRRAFNSYWSPFRTIRFEKSPPNVLRAMEIQSAFPDSHFLILVRNPYANVEGLLRRGWTASPREAAEFWVRTAEAQADNSDRLDRALAFTYEELTDKTATFYERLLEFLPQVASLEFGGTFTAHNMTGTPLAGLHNLNQAKIAQLAAESFDEINLVLGRHEPLLERFGYRLMHTSAEG